MLLQLEKAGSKKLKDLTKRKINEIREARALVSNRINDTEELDVSAQAIYYSRWYYAAIHVLVTIPGKRTKSAIAAYLSLDLKIVSEAIEFLESYGLIISTPQGYTAGTTKFQKRIL